MLIDRPFSLAAIRRPPRALPPALLAAALALAACQGVAPPPAAPADLAGIEVRRIGDSDAGDREAQDRAIGEAFGVIGRSGVDRAAVTRVTVSTPPSKDEFGASRIPASYSLWVTVEGCAAEVFFTAGPGGGLLTSHDRGGCLKGGG